MSHKQTKRAARLPLSRAPKVGCFCHHWPKVAADCPKHSDLATREIMDREDEE